MTKKKQRRRETEIPLSFERHDSQDEPSPRNLHASLKSHSTTFKLLYNQLEDLIITASMRTLPRGTLKYNYVKAILSKVMEWAFFLVLFLFLQRWRFLLSTGQR